MQGSKSCKSSPNSETVYSKGFGDCRYIDVIRCTCFESMLHVLRCYLNFLDAVTGSCCLDCLEVNNFQTAVMGSDWLDCREAKSFLRARACISICMVRSCCIQQRNIIFREIGRQCSISKEYQLSKPHCSWKSNIASSLGRIKSNTWQQRSHRHRHWGKYPRLPTRQQPQSMHTRT